MQLPWNLTMANLTVSSGLKTISNVANIYKVIPTYVFDIATTHVHFWFKIRYWTN